MARRILRSILHLAALVIFFIVAIAILDSRYRVLPNSLHNHIPVPHWHHTGYVITDITYQPCSKLQFLSSCSLGGDWHRIEKDIHLGESLLSHGYINVKRKKEEEFDGDAGDLMVADVLVSKTPPQDSPNDPDGGKWEARPGGIWVKRTKKLVENGITAVDVLYDPDATEVRPKWRMLGLLSAGSGARLTVRKGVAGPPIKPQLRVSNSGTFKIIQIADLHLSTGIGVCRDAEPPESRKDCEADRRTLEYIDRILELEKPDLAVLTGDQVNGETAPDSQTAIFKFAEMLIKYKIPYACIFGNHDDEGNLSREQTMNILDRLPYSLSQVGPRLGPEIKDKAGRPIPEGGIGNYILEVLAHEGTSSAITLYFFDTHAYSMNDKIAKGYDWVKESQINWFIGEVERLEKTKQHTSYPFMHMNMAFIHIPLPEYRNKENYVFGKWREGVTSPNYNSGLANALASHSVSIVTAGHDHCNEYCMLQNIKDNDLWMCYGGGAGFGGYGGYKGYQRRVRLFEINPAANTVQTWKRVEGNVDVRVDEQTLISGGRAVAGGDQ